MIRNVDECGYSFKNGSYDGAAGDKDGLIIDGANWLVKYPKNIGNLERTGGASYSTSPLSEYIGSHIFDILGFPVHETMLVERRLKIAVACKDFEGKVDDALIKDVRAAVEALKNDLNSSDVDALKKKTEDVRQALYKVSSAAYQSGANNQQQYTDDNATQQGNNSSSSSDSKADDDGTIDAEYTDVNDKK